MVPIELAPGVAFDPGAFRSFLADQKDLDTSWAPRYVRVVQALPATATDKMDKKPLRREVWRTDDPVRQRRERSDEYVALTAAGRDRLTEELARNGRGELLA